MIQKKSGSALSRVWLAGLIASQMVLGLGVHAQQELDSELNSELEKLYEQAAQGSGASGSQNRSSYSAPQKQPLTVIEAAPLKESRAEQIRRARQETELMTEQKIVEQLEQSRIEDEKKRADVLFGDKFNQLNGAQPPASAPIVPPPVQIVPPAPVVVEEKEAELDREVLRSEIAAALADQHPEEKPTERKTYFGLSGGMTEYAGFSNVRGNYSVGFTVGQKIMDRFLVEGGFQYSNLEVSQKDGRVYCGYDAFGAWVCSTYPRITNLDQYNATIVGKYHFLDGSFRPLVGGAVSYTYRTYTDTQFALSNNEANSNAMDLGLLAGADLEITENFALGVDLRYFWNLWYKTSTRESFQRPVSQVLYNSDKLVERAGYTMISVSGRASF
jgi:hypothetical protein